MSDAVERLREALGAERDRKIAETQAATDAAIDAVADRIDRWRRERAEVERLRLEIDHVELDRAQWSREARDWQAEAERLRAVLRSIADGPWHYPSQARRMAKAECDDRVWAPDAE